MGIGTTINRLGCVFSVAVGLVAAAAQEAAAPQTPPCHPPAAAEKAQPAAPAKATTLSIPDVTVVDQEGRQLRFYSDLVKGKVVAINFLFTTCTTICPPLSATFSTIQGRLGSRAGSEVNLISVSVDPLNDTPARMKEWLARFRAKPGWTFVSGEKAEIDKLLRALGAYASRKEDHTPVVLIGNDATGTWTRAYGIGAAARVAGLIEAALGATPVQQATGGSGSQ
ncbi:MAG: SCO family protein [Acidobacteriota bacterium]